MSSIQENSIVNELQRKPVDEVNEEEVEDSIEDDNLLDPEKRKNIDLHPDVKQNSDMSDLVTMLLWAITIFMLLVILFYNKQCSKVVDTCIDYFVSKVSGSDDD
jgi:hypothetical protein